ncbi:ATP-dependent metallopeptidase FtsH/Yme1/Tma family protein [Eubacterium sp. AM05-23]|nr:MULTISPECIES: ATP-dependent zinc metalloprotease FtsH [Eubacterium]MBS4859558.1 ATP-dependent zinc metalloprotease FtsH [Eubacterium limosum]MBO1701770.1 ATP-dependent metallopeptidase FtsH/Yme1/Tma family protein [Eubacterium callanderi]MBU5304011.1 ATP-dependent zinc metalloprotease FtsH [Eubacterium callanderi]MBV1682283.1 ATP-dependent zinc metalloprotease FtsH [Eubacterium callanderi]MCB6661097.1 ATP-dependent zinc metalloprotease FtsH [Eubacterium callanderi]
MIGFYLVILLIIIVAVTFLNPMQSDVKTLTYSELLSNLDQKQVSEIEINQSSVKGKLANGDSFEAIVPQYLIDEQISDYITGNPDQNIEKNPNMNVTVAKPQDSWWISLIPSAVIIILMVVFFMMFANQSGGGGGKVMSFGKSKARMHTDADKKVTFANVAGADEEKEELEEIVDFLKSPERYNKLGARIPKGVLLVGPPGTGKTLLARAVAGEAGVPFYIISGSDFVEMFVGVGASRVRDLFETAKKSAPCIIFIDEIDAVGRHRGAGLGGGHDEREQTLNQLLVEMDGFGINEGIIVIAATNRPDILDPALLRPGRFDRQVLVGVPDVKGREEILKVHQKDKPLDSSVDLGVIAKGTPGFTGADLENLMNEAALLTARKKAKVITMVELEEAIKRVIAGPEKKSKVVVESDQKITAYHEAGHAIVMEYLHNGEEVHEISIIPRGMAAGYTISLPSDDSQHMSKGKLMDKIAGLLGGRAAEKVALDDICTGASNDIERATSIARKMVTEWGMSEHLGPMTFGHDDGGEVFLGRDLGRSRNYSEEVAAVIDKEIRNIVETAFERACLILTEKKDKLVEISEHLLEVNTITGEEFRAMYSRLPLDDGKPLDEGNIGDPVPEV